MNELAKTIDEAKAFALELPSTDCQLLLEAFKEYFGMAAEWQEKAKKIKVTDESQIDMMLLAREGRKAMQQARLDLERTRVDQKKFALSKGKAVDGMANVLKHPIIQLESYLREQEDFVVNKAKAEALAKRIRADELLAEQELVEEKALQDKIESDRLDGIKRRKIAEEEARVAQIEKDKAIEKAEKIEKQRRLEREAHQKEIEQKQRENFEKAEKLRLENEKKIAAKQAEIEEREKKAEKRRLVGESRQNKLFKYGVNLDFARCSDMADEAWEFFYAEKVDEYNIRQEKALLEKQRAEKEEKDRIEERMESERKLKEELEKSRVEQAKILKAQKEKAAQVKCPKCSHVFVPPQKLL